MTCVIMKFEYQSKQKGTKVRVISVIQYGDEMTPLGQILNINLNFSGGTLT